MNDRFRPGSGHRWIPVARRTFGMIKDVIMRDIGERGWIDAASNGCLRNEAATAALAGVLNNMGWCSGRAWRISRLETLSIGRRFHLVGASLFSPPHITTKILKAAAVAWRAWNNDECLTARGRKLSMLATAGECPAKLNKRPDVAINDRAGAMFHVATLPG